MLTANQLAPKYAILTRSVRWPAMLWDLAAIYGQTVRCSGIYSLAAAGIDFRQSQDKLTASVLQFAQQIVDKTDAGCLILGGAALTGLAPSLEHQIGVPVVDGLTAAVLQARALSTLAPTKPSRGTYAHPGRRALVGVDPDLLHFFNP